MDERIQSALRLLPDYLAQHVLLSASALALGIVLGVPLGLWLVRHPRLRWPALAAAGFVQTIPGLALLALFYPLLLGLSTFTERLFGFRLPALGFLPSLLALTLYSMLPILRNAVAGLTGLDPAVMEAASAVGMTSRQRLLRVEVPLAAPVVMAGIRTAAVWTIGPRLPLSTSVAARPQVSATTSSPGCRAEELDLSCCSGCGGRGGVRVRGRSGSPRPDRGGGLPSAMPGASGSARP